MRFNASVTNLDPHVTNNLTESEKQDVANYLWSKKYGVPRVRVVATIGFTAIFSLIVLSIMISFSSIPVWLALSIIVISTLGSAFILFKMFIDEWFNSVSRGIEITYRQSDDEATEISEMSDEELEELTREDS